MMFDLLNMTMKSLSQFWVKPNIYFIVPISSVSLQAQVVSVTGKVTSDRVPVSDVFISFFDIADTTLQYSALNDIRGSYQIQLVTSSIIKFITK